MIVKLGEMADNNPSVPSVDVKFDVSDPPASAKKILEALCLGEKNQAMTSSLLDVQPVTGGITNTLFKCTVCNLFTHSRTQTHSDQWNEHNSSPRVPMAQKPRLC